MTSAYRRVWININCLTDHHQPNPPQSLQRLAGTDVWYWQTELSGAWRGSYCFIPCFDERPPAFSGDDAHANMHNLRHWWHQVFASATPDLLNPYRSWQSASGHSVSGLHMPDAPPQPVWRSFDEYEIASGRCTPPLPARLQRHTWQSERLGNSRDVWIYTTGDSKPAERPLAILLDGQFWAKQMPVWEPLMQLTREGALPEAVYVLIDIIDLPHRSRELTCKDDFWLAVQEELMPQLADWAPHSDNPADTVVAGAKLWRPGFPVCRAALAAALRRGDHPVRFLLVAAARHAAAVEYSRRRLLAAATGRTARLGQPRRAEGIYGSRFAGKTGAPGQRRNGGASERRRPSGTLPGGGRRARRAVLAQRTDRWAAGGLGLRFRHRLSGIGDGNGTRNTWWKA